MAGDYQNWPYTGVNSNSDAWHQQSGEWQREYERQIQERNRLEELRQMELMMQQTIPSRPPSIIKKKSKQAFSAAKAKRTIKEQKERIEELEMAMTFLEEQIAQKCEFCLIETATEIKLTNG